MRFRIVWLFALMAASLSTANPAGATPTLPIIIVNHSTQECAEMIQGDDCHWCDPPEGWEVLGYSYNTECPAGYRNLGSHGLTGNCRYYKNQFCCTGPSHHGDCEDLVVNEAQKLCSFVEEIQGCTLPEGWTSATDTTQWRGLCPSGNRWIPIIACVTAASPEPSLEEPSMQEPSAEEPSRPGISWLWAVALGGLFIAAALLILRRSRRR